MPTLSPHHQALADKISDYLQCMDCDAVASAARGEIDVVGLFRAELVSRGLDRSGTWVGFGPAARLNTTF